METQQRIDTNKKKTPFYGPQLLTHYTHLYGHSQRNTTPQPSTHIYPPIIFTSFTCSILSQNIHINNEKPKKEKQFKKIIISFHICGKKSTTI